MKSELKRGYRISAGRFKEENYFGSPYINWRIDFQWFRKALCFSVPDALLEVTVV
jgi:hypothetical protein